MRLKISTGPAVYRGRTPGTIPAANRSKALPKRGNIMLLSELAWPQIPAALAAVNGAAILPVGATEQHGPQLGCGMDFVLADKLCRKVSAETGVPMLPTMPYGCSLGHSRRWPGTIALDPQVMTSLVTQIGAWAYHSGVRRLFIVNTHVTNFAPLRCALENLRATFDDMMVSIVNTGQMTPRVRAVHFSDGEDWHANDAETSLMLAVAPEIVREDQIATADD
ncbi:MAG: creatininase family protein, partial [Hyphomicrobium sp.]|nr:creatininase family protein [Hyphomicrobium sp.]